MTYRMDSDFPIPYAWVDRILPLPAPEGSTLLQRFITSHGRKAVAQGPNLADNKVLYYNEKKMLTVYIIVGNIKWFRFTSRKLRWSTGSPTIVQI